MSKIKLGIIGFGNMGRVHARNVMLDGKVPNVEVTAICDIDDAKLEFAKEKHPNIPLFKDAEEMFKSGLIDSVMVAVPHYDHAKYAMMAFDYNLNVIIEKPAGVYTKQVKEMNERAAKSDKVFGIMYNQRTNPLYQRVKKLVEDGELGAIKRITWIITDWYRTQAYHDSSAWRSNWEGEGGGVLINQNPHQIDLWQWMFGMPSKIYARASFGKYRDIEVEDDVMAHFEYDNGVTGQYITSSGEAPGTNRLEIACDRGRVIIERSGHEEKLTFDRNVTLEPEFNKAATNGFAKPECWKCEIPVEGAPGEQHSGILKNFADAILKGEKLLAPGEEGLNGLTISNAIHLSAWTGEMIDLKNFPDDKFYEMLQDKIKNSTHVKTVKDAGNIDISGTH